MLQAVRLRPASRLKRRGQNVVQRRPAP
jgi:hypothetical protein